MCLEKLIQQSRLDLELVSIVGHEFGRLLILVAPGFLLFSISRSIVVVVVVMIARRCHDLIVGHDAELLKAQIGDGRA